MKVFRVILLLLCYYCSSTAQNLSSTSHSIKWHKSLAKSGFGGAKGSFPMFEGAIFDEGKHDLPLFFTKVEIANNTSSFQAILSQMVFEPFNEGEIAKDKAIGAEIIPKTCIAYEKKIPNGIVSFIPIRKNSAGKFEKLISFNLEIREERSLEKRVGASKKYASASILKSGNWFKIGVTKDGVYKLDYSFLSAIGLSMSAVNPQNIRIYGNGAGMLPFKNSDFRYDDLTENTIFVNGEADGKFDNTDYVLFYGQGPHRWTFDESIKRYTHTIHSYSDTTYYFISVDQGPGKRITDQLSPAAAITNTVSSFDDYYYHEDNSVNLIKSGREWYGEAFDIITSRDFNFSIPNIDASSQVFITTNVVAHAPDTSGSSFDIKANQNFLMHIPIPSSGKLYYEIYANPPDPSTPVTKGYNLTSSDLSINLTYNRNDVSSIAWLDNIEINARRNLVMTGNQMNYRDHASVGNGKVSQFKLTGASSGMLIWDVSNPVDIKSQVFQLVNNQAVYSAATDSLKEFIAFNAFNSSGFLTAAFAGRIDNQNLHAIGQRDMIIVVYPAFQKEANRLADFHRTHDSLKVEVVLLPQIYNEFSSGCQDITAIRDFMKMLYDRSGNALPKHLLLFGDASYNYKSVAGNSNFVPSYEALNSLSPTVSFVTDDYYALLDDNEGFIPENSLSDFTQPLDINVGRFPVQTPEQSANVVDKIIHYVVPPPVTNSSANGSDVCENNSTGGAILGDWRNTVCFVADAGVPDIGDIYRHEQAADTTAYLLNLQHTEYNIDKIYLETYNRLSTPGGYRFPDAKFDLNNRVEKGALVINYTGHGGELGWSASRLLEISDIDSWTNFNRMPLFMTATCEFSRFDDPNRTSAGELVLLKKNGGGIALFTTVRLVFSDKNEVLNKSFYQNVFKFTGGLLPSLGEVFTRTKNEAGGNRNFILLGDPAITLSYPVNKVITTTVNNKSILVKLDTLNALSKVTISGSVTNSTGQKLNHYNGVLYPTVYDKPDLISNIGFYDPPPEAKISLQKNILYKGKASVTNGDFSFTFLIPKDIAYRYGYGKVSYYTEDGKVDGNGYFNKVVIGGSPKNAPSDTKGPGVKLYMNDDKFISGGITDENPIIRAFVSDSSGINTVGNGIGHDITAILDGDASHVIVLNEYYQADLNSYQHGKVSYKLARLKEGKHTLKFKVWDVYNNSSESYLEFVVSNSADFALRHVLNYPNPFTTKTSFYLEHNKPCTLLDVQIQIYTLSGRLVKTIEENRHHSDGYRIGPIDWDGKDDFGDKIARGLYVYRIKVHSLSDGSVAEKYEKLVILN